MHDSQDVLWVTLTFQKCPCVRIPIYTRKTFEPICKKQNSFFISDFRKNSNSSLIYSYTKLDPGAMTAPYITHGTRV